jgi:hypothetical protein
MSSLMIGRMALVMREAVTGHAHLETCATMADAGLQALYGMPTPEMLKAGAATVASSDPDRSFDEIALAVWQAMLAKARGA